MNTVILGTGWLGSAVGKELRTQGHTIIGITKSDKRHQKLANMGFQVYTVQQWLTKSKEIQIDNVIVAIPPGIRFGKGQEQLDSMERFLKTIPSATKSIFVSSTGIYSSNATNFSETSTELKEDLKQFESSFQKHTPNGMILRSGGQFGPDRFIVPSLIKKSIDITKGAKTNLVHLEDLVNVISIMLQQPQAGIYNFSSPQQVDKSDFYPTVAKRLGLTPPSIVDKGYQAPRFIDISKVVSVFDYQFTYSSPMEFPVSL